MITLIPLVRVIVGIAVIYAIFIVAAISMFYSDKITYAQGFSIAASGGTALTIILFAFIYIGWRYIWKALPVLSRLLFPDLNGIWDVRIDWVRGANTGTVSAVAHISQSLLKISMHLNSTESESDTLLAIPKKDPESGRPILYYMYRNTSVRSSPNFRPPHEGAAVLKIDHDDLDKISGNYFTDKGSFGHISLARSKNHQSS